MGIADSLNALGMVAERLGDLSLARSYHEQSLASRREREDPMGIAESLHYLAEIDEREGLYDRAMHSFAHSLAIRSQLADRLGTAFSRSRSDASRPIRGPTAKRPASWRPPRLSATRSNHPPRPPARRASMRPRRRLGKRLGRMRSGPSGSEEAA